MQRRAEFSFPYLKKNIFDLPNKKNILKVLLLPFVVFKNTYGMQPEQTDDTLLSEFNSYLSSNNFAPITRDSLYEVQLNATHFQSPLANTPIKKDTNLEASLNDKFILAEEQGSSHRLFKGNIDGDEIQVKITPQENQEGFPQVSMIVNGEECPLSDPHKSFEAKSYGITGPNLKSCISDVNNELCATPMLTYSESSYRYKLKIKRGINNPLIPLKPSRLLYTFNLEKKEIGIFAQLILWEGWGCNYVKLNNSEPLIQHKAPATETTDFIYFNGDNNTVPISSTTVQLYSINKQWEAQWHVDSARRVLEFLPQQLTLDQWLSECCNRLNRELKKGGDYNYDLSRFSKLLKLVIPEAEEQELLRGFYEVSSSQRVQSLVIYSHGAAKPISIMRRQQEDWTLVKPDSEQEEPTVDASTIMVNLYSLIDPDISEPYDSLKRKCICDSVGNAPLDDGCLPEGVYEGRREEDNTVTWTKLSEPRGAPPYQYTMIVEKEFTFPIPSGMSRYDYLNAISYFPFYRSISLEDSITELSGEQLKEVIERMTYLQSLKLVFNQNNKIVIPQFPKLTPIKQAIANLSNLTSVNLTLQPCTYIGEDYKALGDLIAQIPQLKKLDMIIPYIKSGRHQLSLEFSSLGVLWGVSAASLVTLSTGATGLIGIPVVGYALGGLIDLHRLRNQKSHFEHSELALAIGNSRTLETIIIRGFKHQHDKDNFRKRILERRPDLREEDIIFPE